MRRRPMTSPASEPALAAVPIPSLAYSWALAENEHVRQAGRGRSPWWQMISGMRAYGVAITVVWAMCACTVVSATGGYSTGKG